jgi:hypothetical protein
MGDQSTRDSAMFDEAWAVSLVGGNLMDGLKAKD